MSIYFLRIIMSIGNRSPILPIPKHEKNYINMTIYNNVGWVTKRIKAKGAINVVRLAIPCGQNCSF